jgi:hypothetical protein
MTNSPQRLREHLRGAIERNDYRTLFMEGGCHIFAIVLHEKLGLPLHYSVSPNTHPASTECPHAFVMKGRMCFDYEGRKSVEVVAEKFAEWADVPPRPTTVEFLEEVIKRKGLGEDLERQMFEIARLEFARRRDLYDLN